MNDQDSALKKPAYPPLQEFPHEWKMVCLDIFKARLKEMRLASPAQIIGWGKVRDLIMQPFDGDYSDNYKGRDQSLSDQNLRDWNNGSELKDDKFRFANLFITSLEADGLLDKYRHEISEAREDVVHKGLMMIYSKFNYEGADRDILSEFYKHLPNEFFTENVQSLLFKKAIVRKIRDKWGVRKIIFGYLKSYSRCLDENAIRDAVFYEGFLIPQNISSHTTDFEQNFSANMGLKLFRPPYRGDWEMGFADGQVAIEIKVDKEGMRLARLELTVSPLAADPLVMQNLRKNRSRRQHSKGSYFDVALVQHSREDVKIISPPEGINMEMQGNYNSDNSNEYVIQDFPKGYLL